MRNKRTQIMESVVRELRKRQNVFEVFTDEEFYESPYGEKRRKKNQKATNLVFFHVLVPKRSKNLLLAYFHVDNIDFVVKKELKDLAGFHSSIPFTKRKDDSQWVCTVSTANETEMFEVATAFMMELMTYAIQLHPEYDPEHNWQSGVGINVPMLPKQIIPISDGTTHYVCGRCETEYTAAPRCPECGQLVMILEEKA